MLSQISFTFGSMPVLLEIIKKHPDRDFRLLQATGDNSKLALFDLSGKPTIFNSPITLETLYSVGNDKFKGILHFESFELGTEDKNLLRKQAKIALDSADHSKMTTGYMFSRPDQTNATILIMTGPAVPTLHRSPDTWITVRAAFTTMRIIVQLNRKSAMQFNALHFCFT